MLSFIISFFIGVTIGILFAGLMSSVSTYSREGEDNYDEKQNKRI